MGQDLTERIVKAIKDQPDEYVAYGDLFTMIRNMEQTDFNRAHELNAWLRNMSGTAIKYHKRMEDFYNLYRNTLLFDAPHSLDAFLIYCELNRKPEQRFYQPRRKRLKIAVDAVQSLADGNMVELFLSMPPRVGKTSFLMFTTTWLIGRNSEISNLYSAYSDVITTAFYNGVLEIIKDPNTYLWQDVFPKAELAGTNAKDETINIDRNKRYPSLTCRSLYGTLNGACDCSGFLIADDLIGGIEEALNKERLVSAWTKTDNNLLTRAKESARIIWCGTRWSMIDPIGRRIDLLENDERFRNRKYKIINIPALDENDESNFDYDFGVGFSTDTYRQRRASFERNNDIASWNAQYMGEPIEREGTLFSPEDFRYYNGELPTDKEPDRVFLAVDPSFGGGDFCSGPICYQYGTDIYVHDVVYSNCDKKITQPLIIGKVETHGITAIQIEATKATASYAEEIDTKLKEKEIRINLTTKPAPPDTTKFQRIFDKAPDIREMMIFRESGKRSKEYEQFMQNVFSYKILGKNKNDDAPDSLAMAINMVVRPRSRVEVFQRPF